MRELKFRQPRYYKEKFIDWFYWGFVDGGFTAPLKHNLPNYQYTGLKDSTKWEQLAEAEQKEWIDRGETKETWNGKEIYEGDIIRLSHKTTYPLEVYWEDRANAWHMRFNGEMQYDKTQPLTFAKFGKVIGNIYENKELLNEQG